MLNVSYSAVSEWRERRGLKPHRKPWKEINRCLKELPDGDVEKGPESLYCDGKFLEKIIQKSFH
jgi:hypothetical protein